jgi:hypothetical protein
MPPFTIESETFNLFVPPFASPCGAELWAIRNGVKYKNSGTLIYYQDGKITVLFMFKREPNGNVKLDTTLFSGELGCGPLYIWIVHEDKPRIDRATLSWRNKDITQEVAAHLGL